MLFFIFQNKLRQLNSRLWIDTDHQTRQRDPEFPTAGLYHDTKFIMGVPHEWVPEYSVAGVNFYELMDMGEFEEIKRIQKTGFAKEEKMLWRGWRAIIHGLIRQGYVDRNKAEKLFNVRFEERRREYPRTHIQRVI